MSTKTQKNPNMIKKIQEKTGIDNKKIDQFQDEWIAMPKTRTKYKNVSDAPKVLGEELFAITNDLIDSVQGEKSNKSVIFKKIKSKINEGRELIKEGGGLAGAIEIAKTRVQKAKVIKAKKK